VGDRVSLKFFIFFVSICFSLSSYSSGEKVRDPRYFSGVKFNSVGLLIPIPINPLWIDSLEKNGENTSVLISSPSMYYPSTTMEFTLYSDNTILKSELPSSALSALNVLRFKNKLPQKKSIEDFQYVEYGDIRGYVDVVGLKFKGESFSIKYLYGIMSTNQPVLLTVGAPKGQLKHIEHVVTKVWNKLSVLPSAIPEVQ